MEADGPRTQAQLFAQKKRRDMELKKNRTGVPIDVDLSVLCAFLIFPSLLMPDRHCGAGLMAINPNGVAESVPLGTVTLCNPVNGVN